MDDVRQRLVVDRNDYAFGSLSEADLHDDPIQVFEQWYAEALGASVPEPNAMALATVDESGRPDVRMVLLRGVDSRGFRFYTNYGSVKARELAANPEAALAFYWQPLDRQVRIRGPVERLTAAESAEYFATRPRRSQLAAWASEQSSILPSRDSLEHAMEELEGRFQDREVPLPDFWGGYCVSPQVIEFWQGRRNRLHDRFQYQRTASGWTRNRLAP